MISAAQLAAFQAASKRSADQTIVVQRNAPTSDGAGGQVDNWSTVATVSGNLAQPTAGQMQNYAYLIGNLSAWQVRLPVGTNVLENDELLVGGQTLRVQIVLQPQSYQTAVRLLATEVR